MIVQETGPAPAPVPPAAFRRQIAPCVAAAMMGLSKSTFWMLAHEKGLTIVEYTSKVKRVYEDEVRALIERHTVRTPADRARIADGRRR